MKFTGKLLGYDKRDASNLLFVEGEYIPKIWQVYIVNTC